VGKLLCGIIVSILFSTNIQAQSWQINDSTFGVTKQTYEQMFILMQEYKASKALINTYEDEINLLNQKVTIQKQIITDKDSVIALKEQQLHKLENTEIPVTTSYPFWDGFGVGAEAFSPFDSLNVNGNLYASVMFNLDKVKLEFGPRLTFNETINKEFFIRLRWKLF